MPRYFFDIHDGSEQFDAEGVECATIEAACKQAKQVLPEIALHELSADGDRKAYTVLVRDEQDSPIYSATLTFVGLVLKRHA
ncbi:hypothetical protein OPKNFCMD_0607 [Methylobacterium crusticola]|uniref:DUF6894 domain-containing protein n=1 Tax=Methylobacterium crusticola TaxID=1697972 RepID=A0ABQ4QRF6_9HYPH|nr:hypothetical protein [Methylobacterium crusticola]GJD47895.1 hypothetical protein OPKNFCMD_0607 [Methylobacterium crusticola]